MTIKYELEAELRQTEHQIGNAVKRLRRIESKIPAIIYGAGKKPKTISIDHNQVINALENEGFYSHILKIRIGDKVEQVVIKDIQRHAYKPKVLHMDFLRIRAEEKLVMHVPIHFLGEEEAPGVKEGGVVSKLMSDIEVRCLPANLPEYIEVDASQMGMGDLLHLSDIKLPQGVELTVTIDDEHNPGVISIHQPKVEEEPEEEVAAEEAEAPEASEAEGSAESKEGEESSGKGESEAK